MRHILTTAIIVATTFGAQAQSVTYNHDASKMNQFTVGEIGEGALEPELYYTLLHGTYKKNAAAKNKLTFRTAAGLAAYLQVEMAEAIDSALTGRAEIEALNLADRQIDIAWLAEGDKIESQMQKFQNNIERILPAGGLPDERERWNEYYQVYQCAINETREAYMPNAQRKKEYLQIYSDISKQNETLVRYLVRLSNRNAVKELLAATNNPTVDKTDIARSAMSRWNESKSQGAQGGSGNEVYNKE